MKRKEIVGLSDLGSGMALKSQTSIGLRHATTVVDDLNSGTSGIDYQYPYVVCSGINGILNEFFDDGGRTLNHFAGGDLISDGVWK
jgi:hypothetical protein